LSILKDAPIMVLMICILYLFDAMYEPIKLGMLKCVGRYMPHDASLSVLYHLVNTMMIFLRKKIYWPCEWYKIKGIFSQVFSVDPSVVDV